MQLVGRPDFANVDLPTLAAAGVTLLGRLQSVDGARAYFSDDLQAAVFDANERLCSLFARIDRYIADNALPEQALPPERSARLKVADVPNCLDLKRAGVSTVVWATGYRRDYRWLDLPVVNAQGELKHAGGMTTIPGLYALGLRFQRTRRSNFLDGVGTDAAAITGHLLRRQHRG
jgi:putative flavoprotein involved in K+ transport